MVQQGENGEQLLRVTRRRYALVEQADQRFVVCGNAPNLRLFVDFGVTVEAADLKRFPRQTLFLDGCYAEGPLFDNENRRYSLDHHANCIRAITLATCEQAAVLLVQGLPLAEGEWQIHINDADLDALLACWLLLNHTELLRDERALLRSVMPVVRLEGAIDAHGLDNAPTLSALSPTQYGELRATVDRLVARERELKSTGQWTTIDQLEYSRQMLEALDGQLYPSDHLDRLLELEELAQLSIEGDKLAVLCRSQQGIYAVESQLKQRHDKQLGLILLDQGDGRFTVRQVDSFLPRDLSALYPLLNAHDARVSEEDDHNRWGGANDIGGSPRKTGSGLDGEEILRLIGQLYGGDGWFKRLVKKLTR